MKRGFKRKGDAQDFLDKMKAEMEAGKLAPISRLTMAEVANEWFASEVEGYLRKNTCNWYRVNKDKHIIPHIGALKLQDITVATLQELYDVKLHSGLSETSVYYIHRTLQQIYKYAVRKHYITENITRNPDLKCKRPKKKAMQTLSAEEITLLIQNCGDKHKDLKVAIALAGFMGLRRGEILGLKWEAINDKNRMLEVVEQKTNYDEDEDTSEVKTGSSHRILPIPDVVWDLLCTQKENITQLSNFYGKEYHFPEGFVCCSLHGQTFGKPFVPSYFSKKFGVFVKKSSDKAIRFHDLRHSYASWLIHQKIPVTTVSKLLGHSSPDITLKIYAHIINVAYLQECSEINKYLNETAGEIVQKAR